MAGLFGAPSAMDLSRQRMNFFMQNMKNIPGLAAAFRQYMMRGTGGEQASLIGSSNAFTSGLKQRLAGTGLNYSGIGAVSGALGDSLLGMNMANWRQKYNMGAFGLANQNIMGASQASLTEDDMRNRVIGGLLGTGGEMFMRGLYPSTFGGKPYGQGSYG